MRRAILAAVFVVLATACDDEAVPTPSGASSAPESVSAPSSPSVENPSPGVSIEPVHLPAGTPASFSDGVDAADLPADALVPTGTTPTDAWPATAPDGTQFALIAFAASSDDPLRQARGLIVWRRFDDAPPWRAVYGLSDPASDGVLEIHALIGDASGDGSPDALTFEDTGGSGACGTWRVLDLAANAGIFKRTTCDTTVELSADPAGLVIRRSIFDEDDAHCCPSATRITVLTFDGSFGWTVRSSTEESN